MSFAHSFGTPAGEWLPAEATLTDASAHAGPSWTPQPPSLPMEPGSEPPRPFLANRAGADAADHTGSASPSSSAGAHSDWPTDLHMPGDTEVDGKARSAQSAAANERRKAQNRKAQKLFRERKERYVRDLEERAAAQAEEIRLLRQQLEIARNPYQYDRALGYPAGPYPGAYPYGSAPVKPVPAPAGYTSLHPSASTPPGPPPQPSPYSLHLLAPGAGASGASYNPLSGAASPAGAHPPAGLALPTSQPPLIRSTDFLPLGNRPMGAPGAVISLDYNSKSSPYAQSPAGSVSAPPASEQKAEW